MPFRHALRRPARGIFLIELLLMLAIVAILAGLALPGFDAMLRNLRVRTAAQELIGEFGWSRSEAMRRGERVALALSACAPPSGPERRCGWEVFMDADADMTRQPDEALLHRFQAPGGMVLGFVGSDVFSFDPSGNLRGNVGGLGASSVVLAMGRAGAPAGAAGSATRTVCLNAGGRLRMQSGSGCK